MGKFHRIGVDVGGTFTHGVVLDENRSLLAAAQVPTTHKARFGVAEGIVETLNLLLAQTGIDAASVDLVAHSTTQATNSILEGDVATVGLVVIVPEDRYSIARSLFRENEIDLGEGSKIPLVTVLLRDRELPLSDEMIKEISERLAPVQVLALVESRGTDDPTGELEDALYAEFEKAGLLTGRIAVKAHELSGRLGLKLRAKTAAVNAAMIPATLATARFTRDAVEGMLPGKKLMVMKSEGGVMDAAEMEARPLSCALSGPAAGASAAIHVSRISDGIFLEVGGTSADISLILAGRVRKQAARVGGHVLYTRSLDLRTVAAGGGSLLSIIGRRTVGCGPRSAHIAGLSYLSFPPKGTDIKPSELALIQSAPSNDQAASKKKGYAVLSASGMDFGVTLTDAANFLERIPETDRAWSRDPLIAAGIAVAARAAGMTADALARAMFACIRRRAEAAIRGLVKDYQANLSDLRLVGGGGGVYSVIGEISDALGIPYEVVEHPESISAIGVAAAVSAFSHELFCESPQESDFVRLRRMAVDELVKSGVASDQIKLGFEYDAKLRLLRVEAEGTLAYERMGERLSDDGLLTRAAELSGAAASNCALVFASVHTAAVLCRKEGRRLFSQQDDALVCLNRFGRSLLVRKNARFVTSESGALATAVNRMIDEDTHFSDAGESLPEIYILTPDALLDLSSFVTRDQTLSALSAVKDDIAGACLVVSRKIV